MSVPVLPDELESNARVRVRVDGADIGTRRIVDFVGASAVDNPATETVTIGLPEFSVDVEAEGDGTTDDTAVFLATIDAADDAGGGMVTASAKTYAISDRLVLPRGVGFRGAGAGRNSDNFGISTLLCTHADAGVSVGDRVLNNFVVPPIGGFEIDGNDIATQPLYIGEVIAPHFHDIRVNRAAGTGILIEGAQNGLFEKVESTHAAGSAWQIDFGAGGLTFVSCRGAHSGATTTPTLLITESYGTGLYALGPSQLTFVGCIFEQPASGSAVMVRQEAGRNNTYGNTIFNGGLADTAHVLFHDTTVSTFFSGFGGFVDCTFSGNTTHCTGFQGASGVSEKVFAGYTLFLSLLNGLELSGSAAITPGRFLFSSVTNQVVENGGTRSTVMRHRFTENLLIADARNFIFDTTTGTKFGTNVSQKLGFWNVTPVVQPNGTAYTADNESVAYTGAADSEAKLADLNALRVAYENLRAQVESLRTQLNASGIVKAN